MIMIINVPDCYGIVYIYILYYIYLVSLMYYYYYHDVCVLSSESLTNSVFSKLYNNVVKMLIIL